MYRMFLLIAILSAISLLPRALPLFSLFVRIGDCTLKQITIDGY